MRNSWLYLLTRSPRAGAPDLICPQFVATDRSAMVVSSVSPERWDIMDRKPARWRSEEHTSELQSRGHLVCRLLLEKKKKTSGNWAHVGVMRAANDDRRGREESAGRLIGHSSRAQR